MFLFFFSKTHAIKKIMLQFCLGRHFFEDRMTGLMSIRGRGSIACETRDILSAQMRGHASQQQYRDSSRVGISLCPHKAAPQEYESTECCRNGWTWTRRRVQLRGLCAPDEDGLDRLCRSCSHPRENYSAVQSPCLLRALRRRV